MRLIDGTWLYLIEDSGFNLKLGYSSNLYQRLYAYRETDAKRLTKFAIEGSRCWVLGVREGSRQEESAFHKLHSAERINGSEWYPFDSPASVALLAQSWDEPPMKDRVIWTGEGPHYSLVHRSSLPLYRGM